MEHSLRMWFVAVYVPPPMYVCLIPLGEGTDSKRTAWAPLLDWAEL